MDPNLSKTLLSLLRSNPSTKNLPDKFPLLFPPISTNTPIKLNTDPSNKASNSSQVGIVNVITSTGTAIPSNHGTVTIGKSQINQSDESVVDIPVKVVGVGKQGSKTYYVEDKY